MGPGDVVGDRYRLVVPLGQGGSSQTFLVEDVRTGDRVALKCFRLKGAESWKALELFEREARVLKGLSHPSIPAFVEWFSVDGPDGPSFFLAQALAHGESLAAFLAGGGRIDEAEARRIADQLLGVLRYLHGLTPPIVHRDVKPANIVRGTDGAISLVDFGAVCEGATDRELGGTTVIGTYGFMAPEQFRGVAIPPTDLYGLGATLVFLLTKKTPDQLPQKRLRVDLPKDLAITPHFRAWLGRLLEPAPEDRFDSAQAALTALRDPRSMNGGSRRRTAILAGALAVTCMGATAGALVIRARTKLVPTGPIVRAGTAANPRYGDYPTIGRPRFVRMRTVQTLAEHSSLIAAIDIAPDGKHLLTTSFDHSAKIWSTDSYSVVRTLVGHTDRVGGGAFVSGGQYVVTSGDTTVRLWDASTGTPIRSASTDAVARTLAVSPSGNEVIVGTDKGACLFSLPDLKPAAHLTPGAGDFRVLGVAYSPDGSLILTGGDDAVVEVWSAETHSRIRDYHKHRSGIDVIACAPNGTGCGAASDDGYISLFAPSDVHVIPSVLRASGSTEVWQLAFNPNGESFVTGDRDGRLVEWSNRDAWYLGSKNFGTGVSALKYTPDGRTLYVGDTFGRLSVLALDDPSEREHIPKPLAPYPPRKDPQTLSLAQQSARLIDSYGGNQAVLDDAEKLAQKALGANPRDAEALSELGYVALDRALIVGDKYDKKRLEEADSWFTQALAIEPTLTDAQFGRGSVRLDQSYGLDPEPAKAKMTDAKADVELASASNPSRADALFARMAGATKDYEEQARRAARAAEEAGSESALVTAYGQLEQALSMTGHIEEADAVYRKMVELEPKSAWTRGNYAGFLINEGDANRAIDVGGDAVELMDYSAAHHTIAQAWVDRGSGLLWDHVDYEGARRSFRNALKENPKSADAAYGLVAADGLEAEANGKQCSSCEDGLDRVLAMQKDHKQATDAKALLKKRGN